MKKLTIVLLALLCSCSSVKPMNKQELEKYHKGKRQQQKDGGVFLVCLVVWVLAIKNLNE